MDWDFLIEIVNSIECELMENISDDGRECYIWFEVYCEDNYAEMYMDITRWYDGCDRLQLVDVSINNLIVWDDDNNNIVLKDDYELISQLLELNRLIDCSYVYEN